MAPKKIRAGHGSKLIKPLDEQNTLGWGKITAAKTIFRIRV